MNGDGGWIKIHRSIFKNPWMRNADVLGIWLYILLNVAYQKEDVVFEGKRITIQPGQGLFKMRQVAKILGVSHSKLNRTIMLFKSETQIETQTSPRNTLITVVNWEKYQVCETQNETQTEHKRNTSGTQAEHLPYYKRIKEYKNNNNNNNTPAEEESQKSEYKSVIDAWNSLPLHNIVSLNGKRLDSLKARIKEYSLDDVLKAISIIQKSPFLLGQNKQGWQITVDWFLKPNNFPKVLEGNYLPKTEDVPKEDRFEKALSQPKKGESILFMDIVRAYQEAKKNGETRSLQEYAEYYRQMKRGETDGVSGTA